MYKRYQVSFLNVTITLILLNPHTNHYDVAVKATHKVLRYDWCGGKLKSLKIPMKD